MLRYCSANPRMDLYDLNRLLGASRLPFAATIQHRRAAPRHAVVDVVLGRLFLASYSDAAAATAAAVASDQYSFSQKRRARWRC